MSAIPDLLDIFENENPRGSGRAASDPAAAPKKNYKKKAENKASPNPKKDSEDMFQWADETGCEVIPPAAPSLSATPSDGSKHKRAVTVVLPSAANSVMVHGGNQSPLNRDVLENLPPDDATADEIKAAISQRVEFLEAMEVSFNFLRLHLQIGLLLLRGKKLVKHGEFEEWAEKALGMKGTWRKVLMRLARLEPYFEKARAWARDEGKSYSETTEHLIKLVHDYRVAIGEIVPQQSSAPLRPATHCPDPLSATEEENRLLKQQLAEATKSLAEEAERVAELELRVEKLSTKSADARAKAMDLQETFSSGGSITANLINQLIVAFEDEGDA